MVFCLQMCVNVMNGCSDMDSKIRYAEKIQTFCGGEDPYLFQPSQCLDPLPRNVSYYGIINYYIYKESPFTMEMFRSYKSLEAYKYYESGFVLSIMCKKVGDNVVMVAKIISQIN
ncbi:hypothetical protein Bhyg_03455 [Pseudolycoriella hygida]|uniref:Uncharacterized protein n=1 Tax=Pseudolycoriella hygida TaxID=35572 RepID=A0A9Q0NDD0_9DIPT|nr:hypothetical protein Bhyg_03455 [Pseudolycoriella hygida]